MRKTIYGAFFLVVGRDKDQNNIRGVMEHLNWKFMHHEAPLINNTVLPYLDDDIFIHRQLYTIFL